MSRLPFVKMQGAGNDYVYVDGIANRLQLEALPDLARRVSNRHFGVGSDGLIVLAPSEAADFRMLMWNADGSRAETCGNGLRCLARLAFETGHVGTHEFRIETDCGVRAAHILDEGDTFQVQVDMGPVSVAVDPEPVTLCGRDLTFYRGDAGNPHAVVWVEEDLEDCPVRDLGPSLQSRSDLFPDGVNVEFVTQTGPDRVRQRTFERGSGETLACGSGACVVGLCALQSGRVPGDRVQVQLLGGDLLIEKQGDRVLQTGPATRVFTGNLEP